MAIVRIFLMFLSFERFFFSFFGNSSEATNLRIVFESICDTYSFRDEQ